MDVVRSLPRGDQAVLAVTKSSNAHILVFYWDGAALQLQWLMRDKHTHAVTGFEELSMLHHVAIGAQAVQDAAGRLALTFALPVANERQLYIVTLPDGTLATVFKSKEHQCVARLEEMYLDLSQARDSKTATCYCKCFNVDTDESFVETLQVDTGPFGAFM